tara:strand:- start:934 stop:1365 length:432 start_codon:yes stop_codon:yes gene_type:complete
MHHYKIKPKIGLGDIPFNSSIDEFIKILGKPNEDETIEEENEKYKSRILHYDEYGLSASFDEESNWELTSIAVSEEEFHIDGHYFIGLNKADFSNKINELNFGDFDKEVFQEDDYTSTIYHFGNLHLTFWFENDELQEIQWGI